MANFKLNDADQAFLAAPRDAMPIFAGTTGTETWIERSRDTVVRIGINSVAVATAEGGKLEVAIDIGQDTAKGRDGPAPIETQLRASQAVQVLVKAAQRLAFKAYPTPDQAFVMRTLVWTADLEPETDRHGAVAPKANDGAQANEHR